MKPACRWISAAALCLASLAPGPRAFSAELTLPRDGWTSWEVAAVDGARDWCCWSSSRNVRNAPRTSCRLDNDNHGYGSRDDATTDAVRVYVRSTGGKIDRLRTLSATCPVDTAAPIRDLGTVAEDDSARWLSSLPRRAAAGTIKRHRIEDDVLPALAVNRGDVARDALIRLGNTDHDGEVRSQAWFWLATMGAPEAETAIGAALRKDGDEDVREEAIFALSQLPDERSARALIAAAEDRSLPRELRKRAVFWLSESESVAAQKYLERVLSATD